METKKLTMDKLAPYLPYDLKIMDTVRGEEFNLKDYCSEYIPDDYKDEFGKMGLYKILDDKYLKPILKPLSDFKDILFRNLVKKYNCSREIAYCLQKLSRNRPFLNELTYEAYIFLISNHYDIFGLIEDGLAIENPIKEKSELDKVIVHCPRCHTRIDVFATKEELLNSIK